MILKNDLYDYENRYILQDSDFFKFSVDSILLAEYVEIKSKDKNIVDLCAGNMSVPLILSKYTSKNIVGFEIQNEIYKLGLESIKINNLEKQLKIINDDVKNIGCYYDNESIEVMICNPPYFKYSNNKITNENEILKNARHEITLCLEDIFMIAKKYLINKGCLYLVHRADRVDEIINMSYNYQVNVKEIQFVSTKKTEDPRIVLVKCVKNARNNVRVKSEICIQDVNTYKGIFKRR